MGRGAIALLVRTVRPNNTADARPCWAVIAEKHRVMLFGTFPYDQHWRGVLVIGIIVSLSIVSAFKRFWSYGLFGAWVAAMAIVLMLPSIHAQLSASLHRCLHAHAVSTTARLGASALGKGGGGRFTHPSSM